MPVIRNPRLRHTLWGVVLVFVLLEFGRTTLGKFSIVEGDSMSPTFTAGDFVHARRSYVKVRGDVVVFSDDSNDTRSKESWDCRGSRDPYQGEVYITDGGCSNRISWASATFRNNPKERNGRHLASERADLVFRHWATIAYAVATGRIRAHSTPRNSWRVELPGKSPGLRYWRSPSRIQ